MRIHRDERGQTIILVALSLPLLLGFVGIATDVGALFKDKRTMQTAADAAAIAGALNYKSGNSGKPPRSPPPPPTVSLAGSDVTVNVNEPPTWPSSNYRSPGGTANGYVEVTITKSEPTIFLALLSVTPPSTFSPEPSPPTPAPVSAYLAGIGNTPPTGTPLMVAGSIQAKQCGVVVNSNNSPPIAVSCSPHGDQRRRRRRLQQRLRIDQSRARLKHHPLHRSSGVALGKPPAVEGANLNTTGSPKTPGCYNGLNALRRLHHQPDGRQPTSSPDLSPSSGTGTMTGAGVTIYMGAGRGRAQYLCQHHHDPLGAYLWHVQRHPPCAEQHEP